MSQAAGIRLPENLRGLRARPSLLDPQNRGDTSINNCTHPGLMVYYVNNQPVHLLAGTPLDVSSLNSLLFRLRNAQPRG